MRYVIAANENRITEADMLGARIRKKRHSVRYIFVESMAFYDVMDDASKLLSYDDDICVIIPKWGQVRLWPRLYSSVGNIQIYSGVYGF